MAILKRKYFLPLGMLCLALSVIFDHFLPPAVVVDFLVGVFAGMSVVLNMAGIYVESRRL
jgi:type III secretory pathway component EscV